MRVIWIRPPLCYGLRVVPPLRALRLAALCATALLGTACPDEGNPATLWLAIGDNGFTLQGKEPHPY